MEKNVPKNASDTNPIPESLIPTAILSSSSIINSSKGRIKY